MRQRLCTPQQSFSLQPLRSPALARRRRGASGRVQALPQSADLEWGDIVLYDSSRDAGTRSTPLLGRVVSAGQNEQLVIERLEHDAANAVWLVSHEGEQRVPASRVRRTVQADYLQLVDPDRVSNPHGEHAIEAYRLLEPLNEALEAVREGEQG